MELFRPLLIAVLVITEVAIWQWRMVIAHRSRRTSAMLLGFVGALLQITAITQVVAGVDDPLSIAAYAVGVACGVLFGLVAGERLTPGRLGVTVVTTLPGVSEALWRLGWNVTVQSAHGPDGPVMVLFADIDRRDEAQLRRDSYRLDPDAGWAVKELHESRPSVRRNQGAEMYNAPAISQALIAAREQDLAAAAERHRRESQAPHSGGGWKRPVWHWRPSWTRRPATDSA
jgi:uncharacterized protein YebE (UPF0316 family)